MSDKNLTELEWKKFSKGRDYKDAAFVKALAALEKAKAADAQLEALAEIEKQADLLRKANKADKELTSYLNDLDKALDKQRKLSEFEAKKAAAASEGEEEPDLLSTKMIAPLREVAKGESALPAMVAVLGKDCAVLVSRRPIGASQKKLLTGELGGTSGVKFMPGECIWEANAHTFVLEAKVANLAKLIKAQLLKQTGLRFKVRVRGVDPDDVDDDGEPVEQEAGESQEQGESSSVDPLKADYEKRWGAVEAEVMQLLRAGTGDVTKLRAVAEFVQGKAQGGAYAAAIQGIISLQKLMEGIRSGTGAPNPQPPQAKPQQADTEAEALAFKNRLGALMPRLKDAIAAGHQDVKLQVGEAGSLAAKKDFGAANALLDEAERMLGASHGEGESGESGESEDRDRPTKATRIPTTPLMPIWEAASEAVVDQTTALIVGLRKFDDAELNRMADDLLKAVNDLLADVDEALEEYDQMTGEERAANADEALGFLRAQQRDIAGDSLIRAADSNPLDIKVSLGATLERALDEIAVAFEA